MGRFALINQNKAIVAPDSKVLKSEDYATLIKTNQLIANAEERAQQILADAEAVYKSEKERGYQDGVTAGQQAQAEKMMDVMMESVNYFSEVENRLVDIVMFAVKKVFSDFGDVKLTKGIVKQALAKVRNESKITLHVAPEHADTVRAKLKEITAEYTNIGFIDVVPDSQVPNAACKVETEMGSVDTSIETQLDILRTALKNNFGASTKQ